MASDGLLPAAVVDRLDGEDPADEVVAAERERMAAVDRGRGPAVEDDHGTVRGYGVVRWDDGETRDAADPGESELRECAGDPGCRGRSYGTARLEAAIEALPTGVEDIALEAEVEPPGRAQSSATGPRPPA